ncbi:MAG: hypothetical protein WC791_03350 [Candidatus Paceibacterota bacterium]|jgi:DNA-binding transcriptional regulator PaaX
MGYLEQESKKRSKRGETQRIILETVATAGILAVALVAPGALTALRKLGVNVSGRKKEMINRSRKNLVESGLLEYNSKGLLRLTEKGEEKLRILERRDYRIPTPRKWDKKWRVLIFDIKEERKPLRDKVRRTLMSIGFIRLQDSVWVYPHDCEDLITFLKADFKIGKDLLYLVVDMMENDKGLKKKFGLN